ncbi:hypothetical protein F4777DRAFT_83431 [Nemania sp. FL0916]|nr:hypothetical protein F4777DRAFT_83431 [Nemania sp. FL0916]
MSSRPSIDSARSTSPLIQEPEFRPSPVYSSKHDQVPVVNRDPATHIKMSVIVLMVRVLALSFGFAAALRFAILGAYQANVIALIVFTWVSAAWNALVFITLLRRPSLRLSLVWSDGKVTRLGSSTQDPDRPHRGCGFPRAFWIDLILVIITLTLNVVNKVEGYGRYRHVIAFNWFHIAFHIIITLLTATSSLANAQIRFETVEMPQISLP